MRRVLLLALALSLAMPAVAAAGTKAERRQICAKRGATVASSGSARVFEVDRDGDHSLYGCLRANGRLQLLASWFSCGCSVGDDPAPSAELLAGRFVAVSSPPSCGPFPCETPTTYTLRNLRSGRGAAPTGPVTQVEAGRGFYAYADGRVVIVRGGRERVVDPGPGIEPGSIAIAGRRLYWMRDGVARTAQ